MNIDITKIDSAEILIELREQVENKTIRRYSAKDRFNLFNAYNEINKLHGYGATKDNCPACFYERVLPMIRKWYKFWDESKAKFIKGYDNLEGITVGDLSNPKNKSFSVVELLRKQCEELGIKYHHLHKEEKLKQLIEEANG